MSVKAIKTYLDGLDKSLQIGIDVNKLSDQLAASDAKAASYIRNTLNFTSAFVPLDEETIAAEWRAVFDKINLNRGSTSREVTVRNAILAYKNGINTKLNKQRAISITVSNFNSALKGTLLKEANDALENYNKSLASDTLKRRLLEFHIYEKEPMDGESLVGVLFLSKVDSPGNAFAAAEKILSFGPPALKEFFNEFDTKAGVSRIGLFDQQVGHTYFDSTLTSSVPKSFDPTYFIGETPGSIKQKALSSASGLSPRSVSLKLNRAHKIKGNSSLILTKTSKIQPGIGILLEEDVRLYRKVSVYTGSSAVLNQDIALDEKQIGTKVALRFKQKLQKGAIDREGSPSPRQLVKEAMITALATGKQKRYSSKKTVSKKQNIDKTVTNTLDVKSKIANKTVKPKATNLNIGPIRDQSTGQFTSLSNILSLLRMNIVEKVKENMKSPRLINRTGRFAESVRVGNVTRGKSGMYTVTYSYQTYPYQTFEPGFKQGSRARDPRALISASIRQIVAASVGNKIRAIRVNEVTSRSSE
jgi:hypothetical protein